MKNFIRTFLKVIGYILIVIIVDMCLMLLAEVLFGKWLEENIQNGGEMLHEGVFLVLSIALVNTIIAKTYKSNVIKYGWQVFLSVVSPE